MRVLKKTCHQFLKDTEVVITVIKLIPLLIVLFQSSSGLIFLKCLL